MKINGLSLPKKCRARLAVILFCGLNFAGTCIAQTTNVVPFFDGFENFTNQTPLVNGTNGWYGSDTNVLVVSNSAFAFEGTNYAQIPVDCFLSNRFDVTYTTGSNVWLEMFAYPVHYDGTNYPVAETSAAAVCYINTNGNFVVQNGTNWEEVTTTITGGTYSVSTAAWAQVDYWMSFSNKTWSLFYNGQLLRENIAFGDSNLNALSSMDIYNGGGATSFIDNVLVTGAVPARILADHPGGWVPGMSVSASSILQPVPFNAERTNNVTVARSDGYCPLDFTVATNAAWLRAVPVSGTSTGDNVAVQIFCDSTGLAEGTYVGTVTVSGVAAPYGVPATNSPREIVVTMQVDTNGPVVSAGANVATNQQFNLAGTVSDTLSGVVWTNWAKVSGPGNITFGDANVTNTTCAADADGVYVLSLSARDAAGNVASNTMTLTWDTNGPVVNAGADVVTNQQFNLAGTVSDALSGVVWTNWAKVSGPGNITFGDANVTNTTCAADADGVYVLSLSARDAAGNVASNTMTLTWDTAGPVVDAGADVVTNQQFNLAGTVSDTLSGVVWTNWAMAAGPGNITFGNANVTNTTCSADADGDYVLSLIARDAAGNVASNTMNLTWDTSPPTPDPMAWHTPPYPVSATEIGMVATNAADSHGPVNYQFTNVTTGVASSWQTAQGWTNDSLGVNTQYAYRVRARDAASNITGWSPATSVYTLANAPNAPLVQALSLDRARVVLDAALTGGVYNADGNPSYTEYAVGLYTNSGATNWLDFDGNVSGTAVWGVYTSWHGATGFVISNLDYQVDNTVYVWARNGDRVETAPATTLIEFNPVAELLAAQQVADGSGLMNLFITVINPFTNNVDVGLAYGYHSAGQAAATGIVWVSAATSVYGAVTVVNGTNYQAQGVQTTNSFSNLLVVAWDTRNAGNPFPLVGRDTNVWLGVFARDLTTNKFSTTNWSNVRVDNQAPYIAAITSATPSGAYRAGSTVDVGVLFNESVALTGGTLTLNLNSGALAVWNPFASTNHSRTAYVVNAGENIAALDGTAFMLSVGAGIVDAFGNALTNVDLPPVTITNNAIITIDTTPPTVDAGSNGFVAATFTLHGAVSDNLSGVAWTNWSQVSGPGTAAFANAALTNTTCTLDVCGTYVLRLSARDGAGNTNYDEVEVTMNTNRPTATITSTTSDPTAQSPIPIQVEFSAVVTGFTFAGVSIVNGIGADWTNVNGQIYCFNVYPSVEEGVITVEVLEGAAHDEQGNPNLPATLIRNYDGVRPVTEVSSTTGDPTGIYPIPIEVAFSKDVADFVLAAVEVENGTAGDFEAVSARLYRFNVMPAAQGLVTVTVPAGAAHDALGNACLAGVLTRTYQVMPGSGFAASDGLRRVIKLTWTAGEGVDYYEIWRGIGGGAAEKIGETNGTVYFDRDVDVGEVYTYALRSVNPIGVSDFAGPDDGWCRAQRDDFTGDGLSDLWYYHQPNGTWYVIISTGVTARARLGWHAASAMPADYDGDGYTDPAVYFADAGYWAAMLSGSGYATVEVAGFGSAGSVPVADDYDGDGRADPAVYYAAGGLWRVWLSGSRYREVAAAGLGGPTWQPVPGDFDGDGLADPCVYDMPTGTWRMWLSGSSYALREINDWSMGGEEVIPVAGDYLGTGCDVPGLYYRASGLWYFRKADGTTRLDEFGGYADALPMVGDYDGDGVTDLGLRVRERYTTIWRMQLSTMGYYEFSGSDGRPRP